MTSLIPTAGSRRSLILLAFLLLESSSWSLTQPAWAWTSSPTSSSSRRRGSNGSTTPLVDASSNSFSTTGYFSRQRTILQERKFGQQRHTKSFNSDTSNNSRGSSSSSSSSSSNRSSTTTPPEPQAQLQNSKKNQRSFRGDSKLIETNRERIYTAGKIGTKRYVDPCKVFIGNLPFSVTEDQLQDFVLQTMGQSSLVLHSTKIIREWKTGISKGYGFCIFTDPIYATVCMDVVNSKELTGRLVSVSQGKKKPDEKFLLYLEQKRLRKEARSAEEAAIESGLEQAESNDEDEDEQGVSTFRQDISDDDDLELDALLFGMQGDDDDNEDDLDGIFLERGQIYDDEDIDPNLNREQRREAGRRLKRKKLPHKGFGPQLD